MAVFMLYSPNLPSFVDSEKVNAYTYDYIIIFYICFTLLRYSNSISAVEYLNFISVSLAHAVHA